MADLAAPRPADPFHAFMPYRQVPVANAASGPLAGLRLAVKDLYDVAGYRSGWGSPLRLAEAPVAEITAPAAQRLLDAGARFVGKTHTDEIAWALYGMNAHFGTPVNPRAPDRIPGGSSSGSAVAVAADLADVGLGSDTGGSVRAPASFCGLWGIRPTHGRGPLGNCMELAGSFDTPGVFTRDGATLRLASEALLGADAASPPDAKSIRLATDMVGLLGAAARAAVAPFLTLAEGGEAEVYGHVPLAKLYEAFRVLQSREVVRVHGPWIEARRPPLGPGVMERYRYGCSLTAAQEADGLAIRRDFTAFADELVAAGPLLAPVVHDAPFRLDAPFEVIDGFRHDAMRLLCVAGLAGLPQIVFPAGAIDGAPIGFSLIGAKGQDLALIDLANALTQRLAHRG